MKIQIIYCPELNIYRVHDGRRERFVSPQEFESGAPLESLAPLFRAAKEAVDSGSAASGVHCEV